MRNLIISLRALLFFTLALGVAYPLLVMGVGYLFFENQASGSMYIVNNKIVGSKLIGQTMPSNLFQSRPSANDYNPLASGGSNYSVDNVDQQKLVATRITKLQNTYGTKQKVPENLVFASGSGLDPDITVYAAKYQAHYIAKTNGIPVQQVYDLIKKDSKYIIFNTSTVNVLKLNIDLLKQIKQDKQSPTMSNKAF